MPLSGMFCRRSASAMLLALAMAVSFSSVPVSAAAWNPDTTYSRAYGSAPFCDITQMSPFNPVYFDSTGSYSVSMVIENTSVAPNVSELNGVFIDTPTSSQLTIVGASFLNPTTGASLGTAAILNAPNGADVDLAWRNATGWWTAGTKVRVILYFEKVPTTEQGFAISVQRSGVTGGYRCSVNGTLPDSAWPTAFTTLTCPAGETGTYPDCSAPVSGGSTGGSGGSGMTADDARTLTHEYALKGAGFGLAALIAGFVVYSFRWHTGRV